MESPDLNLIVVILEYQMRTFEGKRSVGIKKLFFSQERLRITHHRRDMHYYLIINSILQENFPPIRKTAKLYPEHGLGKNRRHLHRIKIISYISCEI